MSEPTDYESLLRERNISNTNYILRQLVDLLTTGNVNVLDLEPYKVDRLKVLLNIEPHPLGTPEHPVSISSDPEEREYSTNSIYGALNNKFTKGN